MKLKRNQLRFVINCTVEQLVAYLEEDYGCSLLDAFDKVYNSKIYQKLVNMNTGLYLKSPDYVYDYLKTELGVQPLPKTNKK